MIVRGALVVAVFASSLPSELLLGLALALKSGFDGTPGVKLFG